jgi:hypothetical protein
MYLDFSHIIFDFFLVSIESSRLPACGKKICFDSKYIKIDGLVKLQNLKHQNNERPLAKPFQSWATSKW